MPNCVTSLSLVTQIGQTILSNLKFHRQGDRLAAP
jgi:hypothetical protein